MEELLQLLITQQNTYALLNIIVEMSKQRAQHNEQNDSDFESCQSDQSISIALQIEQAIKDLPSLQLKVQAIAINNYILQKRQLEEKKQIEKAKLEYRIRNSYNKELEQIYAIVDDGKVLTSEDYQFICSQKQLFKQTELEILHRIMKKQQKLEGEDNQISQYWLRCMQNSDIIAEQIHEKDIQVLKFLDKIEASRNEENTKLQVSFLFRPNKWFYNEKITKTIKIDKRGQPVKSENDQIQWKAGMNYTVTVVKKKKKNKKPPPKEQTIREPSFFHFFTSISSNSQQNDKNLDEDAWQDLMEDLEIQHELSLHIYEDLIPKSLEFYLNFKNKQENEAPNFLQKITEKQEENQEKDN